MTKLSAESDLEVIATHAVAIRRKLRWLRRARWRFRLYQALSGPVSVGVFLGVTAAAMIVLAMAWFR
ncbi:MAG: hypothetical protein AAGF12_32265 [Myxococcota bacterium]